MDKKKKITRVGFVADESLNYFISIFVTTNFLGYIASTLGFSDAEQGIINTLATFCFGAQLLSPLLLGRKVKRIVTVGMLLGHLAFSMVYLLPVLPISYGIISALLIILLLFGNLVNNALLPTRLVWLMQSVENEKRGSFTAVKEMISLAGGVLISLLLGVLADNFRDTDGNPMKEYYIICFVALLLMTVLHMISLLVSDEDSDSVTYLAAPRTNPFKALRLSNVRKIIFIDILWYASIGISTPFYASYLREELAFSFTVITILSTVALGCRIAASPLMGRLADKYGFRTTMFISILLEAVAFFGTVFTAPGNMRYMYIVYAVFSGFGMAGLNSGLMNLVYDYVSPDERSVAMGIKSAVGGVVGFLVTVAAGSALSSVQENGGLRIFGVTMYAQQVLSAASLLVVLLLLLYVRIVIYKMKRVDE